MSTRTLAGLLGFAFVAIWIFSEFGWAILCLLGAIVFYAVAALLERQPLGGLRERLQGDAVTRSDRGAGLR